MTGNAASFLSNDLVRQARLLRGHLRVITEIEGADAPAAVRLAAASLAAALLQARIGGADRGALDRLVREGEELAVHAFAALSADGAHGLLSSMLPAGSSAPGDARGAPAAAGTEGFEVDVATHTQPPQAGAGGVPLPGDALFEEMFSKLAEADATEDRGAATDTPIVDLPLENMAPLEDDPFADIPSTQEVDLTKLLRKHVRFETRDRVVVELAGRDDVKELYTRDISKGGLFVQADDPPPLGSIVKVSLTTPDGAITLSGSVVHVLTPAQAQAQAMEPGVGIQFDELDTRTTMLLESYIHGLADRFELPAPPDLTRPLEVARALVRNVEHGLLYEAIQLPPAAGSEQVSARIRELREQLDDAEQQANAADKPRFTTGVKALARVALILEDRVRRLAYDFEHGHERIDERLAAAKSGFDDAAELAAVWRKVHHEKAAASQSLVAEALAAERARDFATAAQKGGEAAALDPLYVALRERADQWSSVAAVVAAFRAHAERPGEWQAVAKKSGLANDLLRSLWAAELPDQVKLAAQLGRRALQAETIKRLDLAVQAGTQALTHDPFNPALRQAVASWEQQAAPPR